MNADQMRIERLSRQQNALIAFSSYAFREPVLTNVLIEASRICAASLETQFCTICRFRPESHDLIIESSVGWNNDVIGVVVSADATTPQSRAFVTRQPVIFEDVQTGDSLRLPSFYAGHGITSTIDVCIPGVDGTPYGVLEVASIKPIKYTNQDAAYLGGYANVLAGAVVAADRTVLLRSALEHMTTLIDDKMILARELQHRVRNNLQLISGMLTEQLDNDDARMQAGIRGIVRRVMSLSRVYDHLLGVGMRRTVDFAEYTKILCSSLPELQRELAQNVQLICDAEPIVLDIDTVTTLGMALAEVISNSYEHAFPNRHGMIEVILKKTSTDQGLLLVQDNGIGFIDGTSNKRHGVGLIHRLLEQTNGTAEHATRSTGGATWTLRFPIKLD